MAHNFNTYFSVHEQLSIRNTLLPSHRNSTINQSKDISIALREFDQMFLTEEDYLKKISKYFVRKSDFVEFVVK